MIKNLETLKMNKHLSKIKLLMRLLETLIKKKSQFLAILMVKRRKRRSRRRLETLKMRNGTQRVDASEPRRREMLQVPPKGNE